MNKIVLESLNKNKKPIISSLLGIVISIVLILVTINTSYYLAFLSVPIAIITVFLFIQTIKQVSSTHSTISSKEENLPDGSYHQNFYDSDQAQQTFTLKNGKREGPSHGYYENGQLKFEINYENGFQTGESVFYDKSNNRIRNSEYSNDEYLNKSTEFYTGGNIRMIQNKSNYTFYDNNSNLRCEIHIQSEILTMDEYRAILKTGNCWSKWHWNEDIRCMYKPMGVWKEFNDAGILVFELNFENYDIHKYKELNVLKTNYDSEGAITSTELISPQELYIERFAANFYFERLVDKKARYRSVHLNPGGWQYAEFPIPTVLKIEDIIKINTAANIV
jgi:antitoxin component YwqK of YwqJK toxin-antitoxin module|tara:strand:+ start:298 stop:1299 length:1002 start_codon:yes stop_codon:yes gene_type:complete